MFKEKTVTWIHHTFMIFGSPGWKFPVPSEQSSYTSIPWCRSHSHHRSHCSELRPEHLRSSWPQDQGTRFLGNLRSLSAQKLSIYFWTALMPLENLKTLLFFLALCIQSCNFSPLYSVMWFVLIVFDLVMSSVFCAFYHIRSNFVISN